MLQEGKNMNNKILIFILCSLIFFTITFCSNTGPQTGTLSGTINLEGQSDHSGIIIGIYKLAELDPDIVEANQKWPHIGVIINQMTEFDHRFGTLIKTGETDASGYFEIKDIPTGVYNVVAIKDSFGFRYIYNVQINDGNNELSAKNKDKRSKIKSENSTDVLNLSSLVFDLNNRTSDLTLFPETTISSDISTPTTFLSHHHYIIEQDIIVDDELIIQPGAVVRLNEGKEITSYGTFNAVGEYENFIWFTKNDGFSENLNSIEPDSNYIWDRVTLEPYSQAQVQWSKFDCANIGLLNHVNGFGISDCIFSASQCGFKAVDVDSMFCSNLLCEAITNETEGGIYFVNCNSGKINNNLLVKNSTGIKVKDLSNPLMKNNYFTQNEFGAELWSSNSSFINNEFSYNSNGLRICGTTSPTIYLNNIQSDIGIYIGFNDTYPNANPEINFNNLINCGYTIYETFFNSNVINAENNYFGTTDPLIIEELIHDKNDLSSTAPYYNTYGIINYIPFLLSEYPNAGIQDE